MDGLMTRPRPRPSRARRAAVVAAVLAVIVVVTTAGVAGGRSLARREQTITVYVEANGTRRKVQARGDQTVTSALIMAGVVPRNGRLLSVKSHRVLDGNLHPARIELDGRPATDTSPVLDGMTITLAKGADQVEGTKKVTLALPAPPLPDVLVHAYHRGRPGFAQEVRGVDSGELVSRVVLAEPVAPRIVTEKVVALTFDDGPTTQWTQAMLNVLASRGVKATFCQIGSQVQSHPDLSRAVIAAGSQLCNHTLGHVEHLDTAPEDVVQQQIGGGADAQVQAGLPAPIYYRPPGGSLGPTVKAVARAHGEAVLFWKVDTEDWRKSATPQSILANLQSEVDNGAIILMHDGGGQSRAVSVYTAGLVIDWLKSQGYGFVFPLTD